MSAASSSRGTRALGLTASGPARTPVTAEEQARRVAWGKQAGAKVAAAYRETTEGK